MDEYILTKLLEIRQTITELERFFIGYPMRFSAFEKDDLRISGVERKIEIIGNAIIFIRKLQPNFPFHNAKPILKTVERLSHGNNRISPEYLWSLIIRHIPILKKDITWLIYELERQAANDY